MAIQIRHVYDDGAQGASAEPNAVIDDISELLPILERAMVDDRRVMDQAAPDTLEAIFFDAGDILYHRPNKRQNLARFLAQHAAIPASDFEARRAALTERAYCGEIERGAYYRALLALYGVQEDALDEGVVALERDDETVEIMPGVPETLRALKRRGFVLGIITDTALPSHIKLEWFSKAGFGDVWDAIISSTEMGVRKPNPAIYAAALEQCGVAAQRAAFVGHRTVELDGAKALGMLTIALHYDPDARADFHLDQFADLITLPLLACAGSADSGMAEVNSLWNRQVPASPAPVDSGFQGPAAPQG
jgi:HAD superfamily hydrolase (TIGR01509 family)